MDLPMAGLCLASAAIAAVAGIPPGTCFAVAVCVVFNSAMVLVTRGRARRALRWAVVSLLATCQLSTTRLHVYASWYLNKMNC
jgi:hypothetical protein